MPAWNLPLTLCVLVQITSSLRRLSFPNYKPVHLSFSHGPTFHPEPPAPGWALLPLPRSSSGSGLFASGLTLTVWAPVRVNAICYDPTQSRPHTAQNR